MTIDSRKCPVCRATRPKVGPCEVCARRLNESRGAREITFDQGWRPGARLRLEIAEREETNTCR